MTAQDADQAVRNGHAARTYTTGMCQQYVRLQCWQVGSLFPSAIAAWNGARYKHPGDRTPPKGAPCYYRGGNYGHAVIFCGPGHPGIRSTDCLSRGNVSDVDLAWVERAWGYEYLGWTEDINGVRVIAPAGEEDEMKPEDWEKFRNIVEDEVRRSWEIEQQNERTRNVNLRTAGNVRDIVRDELERVGLHPPKGSG